MIDENLLAAMRRRIDCPLSWCSGSYMDHGGDGAAPDDWTHTSTDNIPLGLNAEVSRFRAGTEADVWTVLHEGASVVESASLAEIAATLRAWADAVERVDP